MDEHDEYATVLTFWFGELDENGLAAPDKAKLWWLKSASFDAAIRAQFGALHERVLAGGHRDWLDTSRGRLAAIILLDQFSRNMFRETPRMYAADELAIELAEEGLARDQDRELATDPRVFFYMPFMHAESLAAQDRAVELFDALCQQLEGAALERAKSNLKYALMHRDIVARFGRFPHRNTLLGRTSTPAEEEFLRQPGSSF